jgi:hypothetical protein
MTVEIVLSQFGNKAEVLDPSFSSFRRHFPEATFTLYTDAAPSRPWSDLQVNVVQAPFQRTDPRYGWHAADLYKALGLLESKAALAIAIDADMQIVSKDVRSLLSLTRRFGMCMPANPRYLVREDTLGGVDSDRRLDESGGCGFALNTTPIAFWTVHSAYRRLLESFKETMIRSPMRAPLAFWRVAWELGIHPYVLPFQWCVSAEHLGIGNEIILHVGHGQVAAYYGYADAAARSTSAPKNLFGPSSPLRRILRRLKRHLQRTLGS